MPREESAADEGQRDAAEGGVESNAFLLGKSIAWKTWGGNLCTVVSTADAIW
jgi:hypothetical protein